MRFSHSSTAETLKLCSSFGAEGGWPASVTCRCFFAILRDARKIGDMLEMDDAESSPLVGYTHRPESSCFFLLIIF